MITISNARITLILDPSDSFVRNEVSLRPQPCGVVIDTYDKETVFSGSQIRELRYAKVDETVLVPVDEALHLWECFHVDANPDHEEWPTSAVPAVLSFGEFNVRRHG